MASLRKNCVYVGIRGHVVAIETGTGAELWRAKLKGADLVTVAQDGHRLFAATKGELYALDPHTGDVLWRSGLKGLGLGFVSILTGEGATGLDAAAKWQQDQRAAQAAS